jgi:hypothetical protein
MAVFDRNDLWVGKCFSTKRPFLMGVPTRVVLIRVPLYGAVRRIEVGG